MAAALIGTLFGNPWTFPFIWYFTFEIGQLINYGFLSYEEEFSFQSIKKEISTLLLILKNIIVFVIGIFKIFYTFIINLFFFISPN